MADKRNQGAHDQGGDPGLTAGDLEKSLVRLEEIASEGDTPTRKQALLEKATSGELTKSERTELFELLGGQSGESTNTGSEDLVKGFETNEPLQKALDVSDFLREQHEELTKSLRAVGDKITETDNRRHEFNLVMAKAVRDIGFMVKSMAEQFDSFMAQPAGAPKSKGIRTQPNQVLNKGFGGNEPPAEEQLSKGEVLGALQAMNADSMSKGMGGKAACGEDLLMATAKYEQTNRISPKLYGEVQGFVKERRGAAH